MIGSQKDELRIWMADTFLDVWVTWFSYCMKGGSWLRGCVAITSVFNDWEFSEIELWHPASSLLPVPRVGGISVWDVEQGRVCFAAWLAVARKDRGGTGHTQESLETLNPKSSKHRNHSFFLHGVLHCWLYYFFLVPFGYFFFFFFHIFSPPFLLLSPLYAPLSSPLPCPLPSTLCPYILFSSLPKYL